MQKKSSQTNRENLKNYKLKDYNLEILNETIINNKTNIEIADVTPIGKLLYKMISLNNENNNVA
jgi:hypothetical protein